LVQTIELDGPSTRVKVRTAEPSSHGPRIIVAEDQSAPIQALLRSVARAGAPALPPNRPVVVAFPGAARLGGVSSPREDWMLRAIVSIRSDRSLREAAAKSVAMSEPIETMWVTVASNESGRPVAVVAALAAGLVMRMSTSPSDFASAAALRALLRGVAADHAWHEYEVERIPATTLQAWSRPAGSIPTDRRPQTAPGDARWFWAGVLLLLGGESVMRGRNRSRAKGEDRRAA
jgi:hypothetical protein